MQRESPAVLGGAFLYFLLFQRKGLPSLSMPFQNQGRLGFGTASIICGREAFLRYRSRRMVQEGFDVVVQLGV